MEYLLGGVPSHWNLSQSAYSSHILKAEYDFEGILHIRQTPNERKESYSFLKGIASLFVKIPFCVVTAVVSLIEGLVRIIFSAGAYIGACCNESWKEVPGNLLSSAVATDRSNNSLSCLIVCLMSVSLPFSEVAYMLPKIWEAIFPKPTHA